MQWTRIGALLLGILPAAFALSSGPVAAQAPAPFEPLGIEVSAERDVPRACVDFSRPIARISATPTADFVAVEPKPDATVVVQGRRICVDGLEHGAAYRLTMRAGLPAADGARLEQAVGYDVRVPDRAPRVAFAGRGTVLPMRAGAGVPVRTVNVDRIAVRIQRIDERALVTHLRDQGIGSPLNEWALDRLRETSASQVADVVVAVDAVRNREVVTAIPVEELLGGRRPGLYVATAVAQGTTPQPWESRATQWFTVTDLGVLTWKANDGLTVAVRSLADGSPRGDAELRLLSRGNEVIARARTGADGIVELAPGLLRGKDADAPALLVASADGAGLAFLELDAAPIDLSDRGAAGRTPPGALDAFVWSERGIYRPGETVHLGVMLRDDAARAVQGVPVALSVLRPDQLEVERISLQDGIDGTFTVDVPIPVGAYSGAWTFQAETGEGDAAVVLGRTELLVQDFVPPRLEASASAGQPFLRPGVATTVEIGARYLYGAPGADLAGEASVELRAAEKPYPEHADFRFGLEQEPFLAERTALGEFRTDAAGVAKVTVEGRATGSAGPVEAVVRASVFDIDGRPVQTETVLQLREAPLAIGLRPGFGEDLAEGARAPFDLLVLDGDGRPAADHALDWELVEEQVDWIWFEQGGRWDWQEVVTDRRADGGTVRTGADGTVAVAPTVGAGRWRLEAIDRASGVASSVRFSAGWWASAAQDARPERVEVAVRRDAQGGLEAFVRPPFDAEVILAVADREMRALVTATVPAAGATVKLPAIDVPVGGTWVMATALAKRGTAHPRLPVRALGIARIDADDAGRRLGVALTTPDSIRPGTELEVPVQVTGAADGETAHVTLAAVDDAVLGLTGFAPPDPGAYFLGQRAPGVELRDLYGRLIDPEGPAGRIVSGGDARAAMQLAGAGAVRSTRVVSLVSGPVAVGLDGIASVRVTVPDFEGRLRLMAVAWTGDAVGSADTTTNVRPQVLAEVTRPRFLAPGDKAQIVVKVTALEAPGGVYGVSLATDGPLAVEPRTLDLGRLETGAAATRTVTLTAGPGVGTGSLRVAVSGPDGVGAQREVQLAVRPGATWTTRQSVAVVAPGGRLTVGDDAGSGFLPGTAEAAVLLGAAAPLDVPAALLGLDRYAYGCVEQTVSRAVPLLYAADLRRRLGLAGAGSEDVSGALRRLVNLQGPSGEFGGWSPYAGGEAWLTAYTLDFLLAARAAGETVPSGPLDRGLDALAARLASIDESPAGLQAAAYAAWVLARAGRADLSQLRYLESRYADRLPTDLARVQLAAAFRHLGDLERATALAARLDLGRDEPEQGLLDYGTARRDAIAVLAVAGESGLATGDALLRRAAAVGPLVRDATAASPQELAWAVRAGEALTTGAPRMTLAVDGVASEGTTLALRRDLRGRDSAPLVVENRGSGPVPASIAVTGIPTGPIEPRAEGFTIRRSLLRMDGTPADSAALRQGEPYVVLIEGTAEVSGDRRTLIVDLLPAGLEIEPVALAGSTGQPGREWLGELVTPQHEDARDDRWVAALDSWVESFRLAYVVRAVNPGTYVWPGVQVEDMVRPQFSAVAVGGAVTVASR